MYKKLQEYFFNCLLNILVLNIKLIEELTNYSIFRWGCENNFMMMMPYSFSNRNIDYTAIVNLVLFQNTIQILYTAVVYCQNDFHWS